MKVLLLTLLLFSTSCHSHDIFTLDEEIVSSNLAYKVNDCVYLIDPANGRGDKRDAMKVIRIDSTHYWYQWYVYTGGLGGDVLNTIGEFSKFERMTRKLDRCPSA